MTVDIWNVEDTQARLLRISALVNMINDHTEDLIPLVKPYDNDLTNICINMSTVYDLIFDLNADLDKVIDESYHRKTPGE